jgi:cytochrome P450
MLNTPEGQADPYPAYTGLRENGAVVRLNTRVHVAVGYDAVSQMLRDPRLLLDGTVSLDRYVRGWRDHPSMVMMASSLHSVNPPDHTRVRALFKSAFTTRRVSRLEGAVTDLATALVDDLERAGAGGAVVDFMEAFAIPLPLGVFCTLIGVPVTDGDWLRPRWEQLVAVQQMKFGESLDGADKATTELRDYLSNLVAERRAEPRDDLLTALVQEHAGGDSDVSDEELIANLVLLLMAGWETVTNMLGNGLNIMLGHPEQAERLRGDDALGAAFVEEALRYESPLQWTLRWVKEDTSVAGAEIPAKTHVQCILGAANRDPERFEHADRFDPDRPFKQPLTFGAGPHQCLGAALAGIEGRVVFPMLAQRLPWLAAAGEPTPLGRPAQRGFTHLPVTTT